MFTPRVVHGIIWCGLAVLTVSLLVLARTRWGQSQPLGKCIFLSLLAHLLLAMYAMTVEIVASPPGWPHETRIRIAQVEAGPDGDPEADHSLPAAEPAAASKAAEEPPAEKPPPDTIPPTGPTASESPALPPPDAPAAPSSAAQPAPPAATEPGLPAEPRTD